MQVPSGPAGEGSGRPREPDSAAVKGECKVNSGGQRWAKSTVHPPLPLRCWGCSGWSLLDPFWHPVTFGWTVYLYYDGCRLTKPCTLSLPHWYGGEDQVWDGLSFAMAPHTLKEGESVYRFELLEGGRFAEQRQCGVLQINSHCTLFATVFKVKASSLYYASLWTHQVGGAVIADNEMYSKVVITYADLVWIKVGSSRAIYVYVYCGNDLQWQVLVGMWYVHWYWSLTFVHVPHAGGWCRPEDTSVCVHAYGSTVLPLLACTVPPSTPHPSSSPLASASSSMGAMGGCPSLLSPMDTGDEGMYI